MQKALDIKFHSKEHMLVIHVHKTGERKRKRKLKCLLMISGSFQSTDIAEPCNEREESWLTKVGKQRHREVKGLTENFSLTWVCMRLILAVLCPAAITAL